MSRIEMATQELLAALSEAEADASRARAALEALGVQPGAVKPKRAVGRPRRPRDTRPLPDRITDMIRTNGSPVAAGSLAPKLHVSPKQAVDVAAELAQSGQLRVVGTNRRGAPLYEAATA